MRQVVVIPGKPGGEYFVNDFSGLGLYLTEADLDTGTRERDLGRLTLPSGPEMSKLR